MAALQMAMQNKRYSIGVVGYSTQKFNEKLANKLINIALTKAIGNRSPNTVEIVSGHTDLGIPGLAYHWAHVHNIYTVGIATPQAKEYKLFPVDEFKHVGNNWGDESPEFLNRIDALIRIGGGNQSKTEVATMKEHGKPVFEYDLTAEQARTVLPDTHIDIPMPPVLPPRTFSPEFCEVLSKINGGSDKSAILQALLLLRNKATTAAEQDIADAAVSEYTALATRLESSADEVRYMSQALDADLDKLISDIALAIVDFPSANEAVNFYDAAWFQTLAKSVDAKMNIAQALSIYVAKFGLVPATLWTNVANGNPDALAEIGYRGNYMSRDSVGTNT
jgi:hypothetical protein